MRIARWLTVSLIIACVVLATRCAYTPAPSPPLRPRPLGIVIHHSASPAIVDGATVDVRLIDRWHAKRGFGTAAAGRTLHVGYHYLILPDGRIQSGRPEFVHGAHAKQFNDRLGICLVGNFSSHANRREHQQPSRPTARQQQALVWLVGALLDEYELPVTSVVRHRDTGAVTECPGDRLPFAAILQTVNQKVTAARLARALRAPSPARPQRVNAWQWQCALAAAFVALLVMNPSLRIGEPVRQSRPAALADGVK